MITKPIRTLRARWTLLHWRRRGQVIVLVCISLVAMMGMIGVVTDFSFMQHQKNMMQTAADSAAMAGSEELAYGDQVAAGKADAAINGYTDGANSVSVTINNPPSTGPNAANSAYVEAIVSKPEPTYFMRALGVGTLTVSARAVAYEGSGPNCIYVLNPSAPGAFSANGNVDVSSGCGLLVDSSSSSGLSVVGNVSITAPSIGVGEDTAPAAARASRRRRRLGWFRRPIRWPTCRRRRSVHALIPTFRWLGTPAAAAVLTSSTPGPIAAVSRCAVTPRCFSTRELTCSPAVE